VTGRFQNGGGFEPFDVPIRGLVRVVDGGGPDSGLDTVEFALDWEVRPGGDIGRATLPGPTDCSSFPGSFPRHSPSNEATDVRNETGDIVVTDAQPLPTAKNECKNGGWRQFGVFKNQGDCVSFVATGGKKPPAKTG
jgi:hypothetical protein